MLNNCKAQLSGGKWPVNARNNKAGGYCNKATHGYLPVLNH